MSSRRAFYGVVALVFAASSAATIAWRASVHAMNGMPMGGDSLAATSWTLASASSWLASAASFVGMWVVMTPAMMLPSLAPALWRYREAAERSGAARPGRLTAVAGIGYLAVWTLAGVCVLPLTRVLIESVRAWPELARIATIVAGLVILGMSAIQFSAWKARQLDHCRVRHGLHGIRRTDAASAWRHGVRLGRDCLRCCANLMAILLVFGAMDLRAMAVVTAAVTLERVAPSGPRIARVTGAVALGAGLLLFARGAGATTPGPAAGVPCEADAVRLVTCKTQVTIRSGRTRHGRALRHPEDGARSNR